MNKLITIGLIAVGLAFAGTVVANSDYPKRPIGMMVPFGAGGGTDVPARFLAQELEKVLGRNIVVTNINGAGGTVGAAQLAEEDADGYHLGFMPVGTTTTQPHLRGTSYDADSWTPICMVSQEPFYLVVNSDSDIKSVDDYKVAAQAGGIRFAGAGQGSMSHVAQLTLDEAMDVTTQYISTKGGGGDIAIEMSGGRAEATAWMADFDSNFGWRALAIMDDDRSDLHPDVPTMAELDMYAHVSVWFGLFTQAGTPEHIVDTLSEACRTAVGTADFEHNMASANRRIRFMGAAAFGIFFNDAYRLNGQLLKDAGLTK